MAIHEGNVTALYKFGKQATFILFLPGSLAFYIYCLCSACTRQTSIKYRLNIQFNQIEIADIKTIQGMFNQSKSNSNLQNTCSYIGFILLLGAISAELSFDYRSSKN